MSLDRTLWNTLTRDEKQKVTGGIKNHSRETKLQSKLGNYEERFPEGQRKP